MNRQDKIWSRRTVRKAGLAVSFVRVRAAAGTGEVIALMYSTGTKTGRDACRSGYVIKLAD